MSQNKEVNPWLHMIAGGAGGGVGTILFSPLDVVKTRLQSSEYRSKNDLISTKNPFKIVWGHIRGTGMTIRHLYKVEGFSALFKGLGPNLAGMVPSRSISFFSYGNTKALYKRWNNDQESPLVHFSAAASAGIITATATNPIWVVKTRLQLQSESSRLYKNSFHCVYKICKEEGVKSLYKGLSASYLGIGETVIQWMIYEKLKSIISERKKDQSNIEGRSIGDWMEYLASAGTAKLIATLITYPHEVLRTRLRQMPLNSNGQYKYTGLVQCAKLIAKEEGLSALYGGLTPHLMRTVPNAAVLFGTYEVILYYMGDKF